MNRHGHVGSALPGGARDAAALPAPVLVHANYCGVKSRCFGDRGLWLLPDGAGANVNINSGPTAGAGACAAYDLRQTKYAEPLWRSELAAAEQDLRALLADVRDGTVLQVRHIPALSVFVRIVARLMHARRAAVPALPRDVHQGRRHPPARAQH
jgi:hypothetical protein